tara:strand:- start:31 stop:663 length:633 start_codon:yes stop_codon:yes gene_type:complete
MEPKISIIDYGMGNIYSIKCALKEVGLKSILTNSSNEIKKTQAIILPGVGAFPEAMKRLKKNKIIDIIEYFHNKNKLIIGICLGMQLFFEKSSEISKSSGLSLIKGRVEKFKQNQKSMNVGWSQIELTRSNNSKKTPLKNYLNKKSMYFIHSYHCIPEDKNLITSNSVFENKKFVSSLSSKNIIAFQFHPEKSGENGIKVYKEISKIINL